MTTTLGFCKFAINHEAFRSGKFDTHFVDDHFKPEYLDDFNEEDEQAIAAFIADRMSKPKTKSADASVQQSSVSKWKLNRG